MLKAAGKVKKIPRSMDNITPKQRMSYVMIRISELTAELEKLKAERKPLREKLNAMRADKKAAAED